MKKTIICDIDGTLADCTHRLGWITDREEKNYNKFYEEMRNDVLIEDTRRFIESFPQSEYQITFITGRPEKYRDETIVWIRKNVPKLEGFQLLMRRDNDFRKAWVIKKQWMETLVAEEPLLRVHLVLEDDKRCKEMYRELGYQVIDMSEGRIINAK